MTPELHQYLQSNPEKFQDLWDDPLFTPDILNEVIEAIAKNGWDQCMEVLVSREEPLLDTLVGAQAFADAGSNGYTDTMMLLVGNCITSTDSMWTDALEVIKEDALNAKHWDCYILAEAINKCMSQQMDVGQTHMAITSLRIELLHALTPNDPAMDKTTADGFVLKATQSNNQQAFDSWMSDLQASPA